MKTRPKLLITAPFDGSTAESLKEEFQVRRQPPEWESMSLVDGPHAQYLADAQAVVCELDVVDQRTLDAAPELRMVVSCRSTPTNVDLAACEKRGITVATTPARNADVTADVAFGLLLSTVRQLSRAEQWLRSGAWRPEDAFYPYTTFRGMALNGRTLGIIGAGAIGQRVAERAMAFGMHNLIFDPYMTEEQLDGLGTVSSLEGVMAKSDIVTIHAPLNDKTEGLIGAEELALMPTHALLINAGRAAIVDETALIAVLRDGCIAGAGLDVFWEEPLPRNHALFDLDNVTMTPHIAGASDDVILKHSRIAAERLRAWLAS